MNVLRLLKKDHANVKALFSKYEKAPKTGFDEKGDLFAEIRRELQLHTKLEEEIFYPAVKACNGDGRRLVTEALREHKGVDELLTQASRLEPEDSKFDDQIETLIENVDHHVEEEEGEIFQFAEENLSAEELEDLGAEIEERKKTLEQQMAA